MFRFTRLNSSLTANQIKQSTAIALSNTAQTLNSDGYLFLSAPDANSYIIAAVTGSNTTDVDTLYYTCSKAATGPNGYVTVFLRKGMKAKIFTSSGGNVGAIFYPLS